MLEDGPRGALELAAARPVEALERRAAGPHRSAAPRPAVDRRALIEPARQQIALGFSHAGLVGERHGAQHHDAGSDRLRARADALGGLEADAVRRDPEDVAAPGLRAVPQAAPVDDVP